MGEDAEQKVVIIGAGFGGLAAAKALADAPVAVTVVDKRNHHTFQPLLYQVATAGLDADDICYATRGIFHRQTNANAVNATVTDIDFEAKEITTGEGLTLEYDQLVLALGAVTADFGVPGVADHAFGLKSASEALRIRSHVLAGFERADRTTDQAVRAAATTIVLVGGGPTGVEMAGGFAELIDRPLRRDFPALEIDQARVILVEGQDRLLGSFAPALGSNARARLEKMGVEVRLSTQVAAVEPGAVRFADGTSIQTDTVVWAAGVRADPLAERLGLPVTGGGRVVVDEHLRVPGYDGVFAIGDLAASPDLRDDADGPVPQVAPGAMQGGQHVAKVIAAGLEGRNVDHHGNQDLGHHGHDNLDRDGNQNGDRPRRSDLDLDPFRYRDKGSMATIGRNAAVVEMPIGPKITGFPGWVAWLGLHLVMLIGFRNRANVLVNWAWNYLTYDRGSRLIIEPDQPVTDRVPPTGR